VVRIDEEIGVFGWVLGDTNLWMIAVFDGWIGFGVKFKVDLV